jgi:pimeloyl-ACP methyl ester carboxylesterase
VLRSIVHDPATVTPEQVAGYADPLRAASAKARLIACVNQLVPDGLDSIVARYPTLDLPVLLLWGRQDPVVSLRSVGERLATDLPRAQLAVLDACGHLPPEEHPEASLAIVQSFLRAAD